MITQFENIKYLSIPTLPSNIVKNIIKIVDLQKSTEEIELLNANESIRASIEKFKNNKPKDGLGIDYNEVKFLPDNRTISKFSFLDVDTLITDWVDQFIGKSLSVNIQVMEGGNSVIPHIDEIRIRAYNYIIETGGYAETCFYKIKDEFTNCKIYPQTYLPYGYLNKIEGKIIESHKWHQLNVSNIHSVERLDPIMKRIALTVSFKHD